MKVNKENVENLLKQSSRGKIFLRDMEHFYRSNMTFIDGSYDFSFMHMVE